MRAVAHLAIAMYLVLVAGCDGVGGMTDRVRDRFGGEDAAAAIGAEVPVVPAIEKPDVSGPASWDGTPSLGGVWVAHPDVVEAERVRISRADGGSVEGWLFSRDAGGDGPALQVSSEAALALGVAAGAKVDLTVEPLAAAPGTG